MRNVILSVLIMICLGQAYSQSPAVQLLEKSIAYHDPNDRWDKWAPELTFTVLYPGKPDGSRSVSFDNKKGEFQFCANYADGDLIYQVKEGAAPKAIWNDSENIPEKAAQQYSISLDKALLYRNYYKYLYGMPMKLKDPGTNISPEVADVTKDGVQYQRIKVTYDESVGKDTWYFYFDPISSALLAYQFFKNEAKNDGEFILFAGEVKKDGITIPKDRIWYYNIDGKYLATDVLN